MKGSGILNHVEEGNEPTPDVVEWLVPARTRIQTSLLMLYQGCIRLQGQENARPEDVDIFRLLLGAGFPLWRSVFQARANFDSIENLANAQTFLQTVLQDNAVVYRTEVNSWSFGYYLNNTIYRLVDIQRRVGKLFRSEFEFKLQQLCERRSASTSESEAWDATYAVFEIVLTRFLSDLSIQIPRAPS